MNKIIVSIVVLFSTCINVQAQQQVEPNYTQYMFNTMTINPAYVGSKGHIVINALARMDWFGVEGTSNIQTLSVDVPLGYSDLGVGLGVINHKRGPVNKTSIDANGSYTIAVAEKQHLAFGIKAGVTFVRSDASKGKVKDLDDEVYAKDDNFTRPLLGAGLYYYGNDFYVGLSVPNFLKGSRSNLKNYALESPTIMHFYLMGGYVFKLSDNLSLKPAFLSTIINGSPFSMDISANCLFYQKYRAGIAYRIKDSIAILLGMQVMPSLHVGLAYDLTTTESSDMNNGSYELMLRYEILGVNKIKSPRFF